MSWVLGYEIAEEYVQIAYYDKESKQPESVDGTLGLQKYEIPFIMVKKQMDGEVWIGHEAVRIKREQDVFQIDGTKIRTEPQLLHAFILKSFKLLSPQFDTADISHITFTLRELDYSVIQVIQKTAQLLGLKKQQYTLQDYRECFFYYMMHQDPKLRSYTVAYFEYIKDTIYAYEMDVHKKTFPKVVTIRMAGELQNVNEFDRDEMFARFISGIFRTKLYSAVYLTGEDFSSDWMSKSLHVLCRGRRVFSGNNLYVKGACYRALDELKPEQKSEYVFLGKHKLMHNVGIDVSRNGKSGYFGIVSGGINWFDAKGNCDILLDGEESIEFCIRSVDTQEMSKIRIPLEGLPKRPEKTSKIRIEVDFTGTRECRIHLKDMGFGEWFPASGCEWTERLKL